MGLGTKVHGLKERIQYLDGVISTEAKQQAAKSEREKVQQANISKRAKEEHDRQEREEERKQKEDERSKRLAEERKAK